MLATCAYMSLTLIFMRGKERTLQIQVVYKDGREDLVEPGMLDVLLTLGELHEFRRSDHWVVVSEDPIRQNNGKKYTGVNRRLHVQARCIAPSNMATASQDSPS